jgi:transcriptional regulator with XRE-family HTH domain
MKSEQAAFGERLRRGLKQAGLESSPAQLVKLLARHGGTPVSPQAASGWLNGKSLPKPTNMRALAKMLKVEIRALQYGEESGRKLRDPAATEWKAGALDQLAIDTYLALPAARRQLVRALIDALAEGEVGAPG